MRRALYSYTNTSKTDPVVNEREITTLAIKRQMIDTNFSGYIAKLMFYLKLI